MFVGLLGKRDRPLEAFPRPRKRLQADLASSEPFLQLGPLVGRDRRFGGLCRGSCDSHRREDRCNVGFIQAHAVHQVRDLVLDDLGAQGERVRASGAADAEG